MKTKKYYKVIYETSSDGIWDDLLELENSLVSEIKLSVYNDEAFKKNLLAGHYVPYIYAQFVYLRKDMLALEKSLIKANEEQWDENSLGYLNSNLVVWVFETTRFLTRVYLRMTDVFKKHWPKFFQIFEEMIEWYKECGREDEKDIRYVRNTVSHYDAELKYANDFQDFINFHKEYVDSSPLEAIDRNTIANGLITGPKINNQMKRINLSIHIVAYELLNELSHGKEKQLVNLKELTSKKLDLINDKQKNV